MDTEAFSILTISLFEDCAKSFVGALDLSAIPHGRMQTFASVKHPSPIIEVISAPSQDMPWDNLALAIFTWLRRKSGREIMITIEDKTVSQAQGCTVLEVKNMLLKAVEIKVMDGQDRQIKRVSMAEQLAP